MVGDKRKTDSKGNPKIKKRRLSRSDVAVVKLMKRMDLSTTTVSQKTGLHPKRIQSIELRKSLLQFHHLKCCPKVKEKRDVTLSEKSIIYKIVEKRTSSHLLVKLISNTWSSILIDCKKNA